MTALDPNSTQKAEFTGKPVNVYARFRPDLSRGARWSFAGARFVVVVVTRRDVDIGGSVFEIPCDERYVLKALPTRQEADAEVVRVGPEARVFAIRPSGAAATRAPI